MAGLYGPHYEAIWRDALLLPGHDDLFASLVSEVALHYGLEQGDAERRLEAAWMTRADRLAAAFPIGGSEDELRAYYSQDDGVLVSMYWHSLRPDRYALHAVAGLHHVQLLAEGSRVFEFGHGVGPAGILFARHGFDITLGDISESYRSFAQDRLAHRSLVARFVDLVQEEPEPGAYDAVVSFDVMEHVPDAIAAVERLRHALRPGGVLVMNVAFGLDPANPEHLLRRRRGFVDRIRPLGFERVPAPTLLVYYRSELDALRRGLYRLQDTIVALSEDARALAASRAPP